MKAKSLGQRVNLKEKIIEPGKSFKTTIQEAVKALLYQPSTWAECVRQTYETMLQLVFYQNFKKGQFNQTISEILLHEINHGIYHHGQWITPMH